MNYLSKILLCSYSACIIWPIGAFDNFFISTALIHLAQIEAVQTSKKNSFQLQSSPKPYSSKTRNLRKSIKEYKKQTGCCRKKSSISQQDIF